MLYITKNQQGPVTAYCEFLMNKMLYITKNQQGPVTIFWVKFHHISYTLLKINRVL